MANKNYRSANNRTIDMDTLRLKNEEVRAVGNMGVNARGDKLDNKNKTVDSRNRRVSRQYKKQTNVVDQPVADSIADAKKQAESVQQVSEGKEQEKVTDAHLSITPVEPENESAADTNQKEPADEPQGLAAAIARAREVKQEEIVPPRKAAQQKPGVKKI